MTSSRSRTKTVSDGRWILFCFCAALAGLTAMAYAPMLHAGFLSFDDNTWVAANSHVNTGLHLANIKWAFTSVYASNYVPLAWISHMLDCQLFGLAPGAHHAINILLHCANTALFFLLLKRFVKSHWTAALAATLFGLHPIHVESVAWIAERKDVLSAFFWLLACHAYFYYTIQPNLGRYFLVLSSFALGLLAKSMLVTLPFVLLLLDVWPLRRVRVRWLATPDNPSTKPADERGWIALVLEKVPLAALALAECAVTFFGQRAGGTMTALATYPLTLRAGNAVISYVAYLAKLFVPVGLPVVEPLVPHPLGSLPVLAAILVLVLITALTVAQFRQRPYLALGWFWYLGTLVPVIGIVQVGGQGIAYRYTYIPFLGLSISLACALDEFLRAKRFPERAVAVAACVLALALSALTWRQVHFWRDSETLYRYSLQHSQRNWVVLNNLGVYLVANQRYDEAISCLQQVLLFSPEHFQAASTLGFALEHTGRTDEAVRAYQRAAAIRPQDYRACENLITVLSESKRFDEALAASDRLIALDAARCDSFIARGSVFFAANRSEEAVKTFEQALTLDPSNDAAKYYLALACRHAGQPAKAVQLLEPQLKLGEVQRLNRFITLGAACRDLREYRKSAEVLRQGLREFPNRIELAEPLAQVEYTFLKDYSNALPHLELVLKLQPNHPDRATYLAAIRYVSRQLSLNTNLMVK
jgi:tetratricopeptide (TPR) repeat protein